MATGLAIGVTVVGVAAILALLGILARQLGLWAWAWNWLKATNEEKTKLCHTERTPINTGGRTYLQLENDLDWINLWPRSGSYKRFSNLDDVNSEDAQLAAAARLGSNMIPDPPIPPQPLRPAPGPPHRMPGRYDGIDGGPSFFFPNSAMLMGMMMGNRGAMHHTQGEMDDQGLLRRDSNRSLNSRNLKNLAQDYDHEMLSATLPRKTSTNPFHSNPGMTHGGSMYPPTSHHYSNPFSPSYQYPTPRHFQAIEEDNRINHTLIDDRMRHGYSSTLSRSDHHLYTNNYEEYSRLQPMRNHQSLDRGLERIRGQSIDRGAERITDYNYSQERVTNSSQIAYAHSLNQALAKQRKLQQSIKQQIYINKMKQDEERIREEERILQQLRYENDLMRRERYENSIQNNASFDLNGLNRNIYDIEETRELQREAMRENIAYDFQRGASDIKEEFHKRKIPQITSGYERMGGGPTFNSERHYSANELRDSPPPPAPDLESNPSYPESPELSEKEAFLDWRDRSNRESEGKSSLEIPATPPNTASLTPPTSSTTAQPDPHQIAIVNPYSHSILQERLAKVEQLRYKEAAPETYSDPMRDVQETIDASIENNIFGSRQDMNSDDPDSMYPNVFSDPRDDIGDELTQKQSALREGKGPDIYPRALRERIERRREREGSRRKRKRELERRSSSKSMLDTKSIDKLNKINTTNTVNNQNMVEITMVHQNDNKMDSNREAWQDTNSETENRRDSWKDRYTENDSRRESWKDENSETESHRESWKDRSADSDSFQESWNNGNSDIRQESALKNVPIGLVSNTANANHIENSDSGVLVAQNESPNVLSVSNVMSIRNLGDSPVVPRKSFLSYKGSWDLEANSNDESEMVEAKEDDPSTIRVREYIASLSARLQQLPDNKEEKEYDPLPPPPSSTPPMMPSTPPLLMTPPPSVTFPATPPSSADRTYSQSSMDTPSSTAATWGSMHAWRMSTETPPNSAGFYGGPTSPRPSYSDTTPPSSAGYYAPTPPNSASSNFAETPPLSAGYPGTPPNSCGLNGSFDLGTATPGESGPALLKRAASCDSVNSDTSVTLGELEDEGGQITGQLSVQIIYDCDTADLEVVVIEGRNLIGPDTNTPIDSYVRVYLLPDKSTNMQTRVTRRSNNPSYRERFLFALEEEELLDRSLVFYVYASDKHTNTLIGESQVKLSELDLTSSAAHELALTDSGQKGLGYGEIMFSLSYLPTAERLTVVVVKARSLQFSGAKTSGDPFVKVYILQNGKKIMKKKTSVKKDTNSPVFNDAMIFNIPAPSLHNIQLRLTVAEHPPGDTHAIAIPIGHVIVGTQATGKALSHWNQMMSSLRKPIGMWHALRR